MPTPSFSTMVERNAPSQGTVTSGAMDTHSNDATIRRVRSWRTMPWKRVSYIDEFNQRVAIRRSKVRQSDSPAREPSTVPMQTREDHDRAAEEAAWVSLRSRLDTSAPAQPLTPPPISLSKYLISSHKKPLLRLSSPNQLSPLLLTSLTIRTHCLKILTSTKHRNAKLLMRMKNPSKI
jgi:hypothetical protein